MALVSPASRVGANFLKLEAVVTAELGDPTHWVGALQLVSDYSGTSGFSTALVGGGTANCLCWSNGATWQVVGV
jgi:hypothetical protein